MTSYAPSGTAWERRRPTSVIGVLLLVVLAGLGGAWIGRESVTSTAEQVTDVRRRAGEVAAEVERLDDEYSKALESGKAPSGVLGSLKSARSTVQGLVDDAPWVTDASATAVLDTIDAARDGADASVLLDDFQDLLDAAAAAIRGVFGVSGR